jgi:ABC-type phosphate transport system substrate-binding protein
MLLACLLALAAASARADVVVVVGAGSPIAALSADDIARIFLGKTETTSDGGRVVPVDAPEGTAVREAFYRQLTGKTPAQVRAYWARLIFTGSGRPPRQLDTTALAKLLDDNPRAIGYVDRAAVPPGARIVYSPPPPPPSPP